MAAGGGPGLRPLAAAAVVGKGAARMEGAAGRRGDWAGHLAGKGLALPADDRQVRNGFQQEAGVGVPGRREESLGLPELGDATERLRLRPPDLRRYTPFRARTSSPQDAARGASAR